MINTQLVAPLRIEAKTHSAFYSTYPLSENEYGDYIKILPAESGKGSSSINSDAHCTFKSEIICQALTKFNGESEDSTRMPQQQTKVAFKINFIKT